VGFEDVTAAAEDRIPVDLMTCDPTVLALIKQLKATQEQIRRVADAVVSVKVSAVKPPAGR
jgi:hypothetical protein